MKSRNVTLFLTEVVVFSAMYFLLVVSFGGKVIGKLDYYLPEAIFNAIYFSREEIALLLYVCGVIVIGVLNITRLLNLLDMAGDALHDKKSVVFSGRCPGELEGFSAKLREFYKELEYSEKARMISEQQKNDLIVYLAHDLKTPLTSVIGYLSVLNESGDIPAGQREKYTSIALSKAYRLEMLINEFFEMTRLNFGGGKINKTTVDLSVLLYQMAEEFFPVAEEKKMNIISHIDGGIKINADVDKIIRVFDNLIKNALSYGYEGTDVVVSAFVKEKNIFFSVKSTGDEIPDDMMEHIFDKFVRMDSSRQTYTGGSGLGLAIAREITLMHGGDIKAEKAGNETTFTVILPM